MNRPFPSEIRTKGEFTKKARVTGLFILFILPVALLFYTEFSENNKWTSFTQKERIGLKYNHALRILLEDMMHHRGMSNAYLSGDSSFSDDIKAEHSRIEGDIKAIDLLNKKYGKLLKTGDRWNAFKTLWNKGEYTEYALSPDESFESHTALIKDIISLMSHVGETSNLILDPELTTYYLMNSITFKLPAFVENIGQTRAAGVSAAVTGRYDEGVKRRFIVLDGLIRSSYSEASDRVQKTFESDPGLGGELRKHADELKAAMKVYLDMMDIEVVNRDVITIAAADYYKIATKAIDTAFILYDKKSNALDRLLKSRINEYEREKYLFGLSLTVLSGLFVYVFTGFMRSHARLEISEENFKQLSVTDPLTQIYNRRKFDDRLELEIHRAARFKRPFSVIMFDIDHFKDINDTFGHEVGDETLKTLTNIVSGHARATDTFARWGGEEFIILVVETPLEGACLFAEKLRKAIEGSASDATGKITCSFGVTEFRETDDITSIAKRVDDALYEAKDSGRNRVCAR